ncbi:MAG: hypothetical protein KF791_10840 [Verrucomicrobiae bacterium]|nr:hypothetical protein [Verrucomicrobiae bacterium]
MRSAPDFDDVARRHRARSAAIGLVLLLCAVGLNAAAPVAGQEGAASPPFLLAPPPQDGPVVVHARFDLHDINEVNDGSETFEFTGALTLEWQDPRQAFDPAVVGVEEKIFTGDYQFNELATGWYPQVVLANVSGLYQKTGVVLRVRPDGRSTLIETMNAAAESEFDMRRFPFDSQRLEAIFEVLGFDADQVRLQVDADASRLAGRGSVPQWTITSTAVSARDLSSADAGRSGASSALLLHVDVERQSWFVRRLVVAPLVVIVLLSFSVFWMDRASLGDRVSVSFIGILTVVAYQLVTSEQLPRIAYVTVIHGFLNISFLTMCATVVVNLVVGKMDQRGQSALGDRVDRICRWAFPLVYFTLIGVLMLVELVVS